MPDEQLRYCPRCETSKPVGEFYRNGNGWTTYCKPCNRSYAKERHKNKKDKKLQRTIEYKEHTAPSKYSDYELFEPFDVPPRPQWLLDKAKEYDVELDPQGSPFQVGVLLSTIETPAYTLSIAGSQDGKAQPYDAVIYGENGKNLMGDIKLGDKIFGSDGKLHSVVGIYEQGERDVYSIETENGAKTECDIEHLWKMFSPKRSHGSFLRWSHGKIESDPKWNKTEVLPLSQIVKRYGFVQRKGKTWAIPITKKVSWKKRNHIIPPYSMGVLIGDGSYTNKETAFTSSNDSIDLIERIRKEIGILRKSKITSKRLAPTYSVSKRRGIVRTELDRMGLGGKKSCDKFIPEEYLFDSSENRLELLRGLMDTDGSQFGKGSTEFYSKSYLLAENITWLVRSLGGRARIKQKDAYYTKNGIKVNCGICYRIKIWMSEDNPFFIQRKASRWYKIRYRNLNRIKEVKYVGRKECRCLLVDGGDHTYLTDDFIVTHNSRPLLMDTIIMATGVIPFSLQYDKGVDTGIPRKVTKENIKRFGLQPDGTCGNVIGVGKYPKEKIPPQNSGAQIWIGSIAEVKHKMWEPRLRLLIPPGSLLDHRGNQGWSYARQMFTFKTGVEIRLITYEQKYRKTEGEMAWMIILDEEPPDRQYFISAMEHCKYLRFSFSPINGLNWSYHDCYLPAIQDRKSPVKIFSCTQYDSPFHDRKNVDAKLLTYKKYEVRTRVFGQFSEMVGKPYYTYEIAQQHLKRYMPRHTLVKFMPMSKPETVREMLDIKVRAEPAEEPGEDVWEVYEKYSESDAYWISADVAKGDENPDIAGNTSVAYIFRLPRIGEKELVMVAALQSRLRNVEFAWNCLYAACYFSNALIAPETGISADGAVFLSTVMGYPHLYRHTSTNFQTKMLQERLGFDTKSGTRKIITDLVGTFVYSHLDNSKIYHYSLLKEISEAICGKDGRLDHPERGSTDCIIAFGIGLYVFEFARSQIRNNRTPDKEVDNQRGGLFPNIFQMNKRVRETRPIIGSCRGMDQRFGYKKPAIYC